MKKEFKLISKYKPKGDQPQAIRELTKNILNGEKYQTLLGVTGSGKTFTMANVIANVKKPTLVISHNKTLAAQLYGELKQLFPENAVEFFISYYDYYQPEAYIPGKDIYIEKDADIKSFRQQELELRKKQRKLETAAESLELELARKLDEEREKIRAEVLQKADEKHRLKDLEKDKVINDLRVSLEDMKRKAEQGSMETQGEVLEQDFEAQLKAFFVHDDIAPVPKGIRGADLVQTVRSPLGAEAGILLWEIKNTKAWSPQWIPKLKDDMIEIRAALAILVSVVLPAGINRFGRIDGVWVSDPLSAVALAAVLREQLMAISRERTASMGKSEKMEALYQYLAGVEFKQKIEGIVEAFTSMQDQLNKERRAMERHWKQREKEIERVVKNTVGLYGDMQGIIGGQIPIIPALELDGEAAGKLPGGDCADD